MRNDCFFRQGKSVPSGAVGIGVIFILLNWIVVPLAQGRDIPARKVQRIEGTGLKALEISNLVGLLASPTSGEFFILDRPQVGVNAANEIEIKNFNLDQGTVSPNTFLLEGIADPINTVFDKKYRRIVGLRADNERMIEVSVDAEGVIGQTSTETDISSVVTLRNPQGITTNPETGVLYILDSGKIVGVEPEENSGEFAVSRGSEITLPTETGRPNEHRGIAFNPSNKLLYIFNPVQKKLYSITTSGVLINTHNLSDFGFSSSGAIVFAASGDSTDGSGQLSIYVVDQGAINSSQQVVEISLRLPISNRAAPVETVTAKLVQVIDTSRFVNPNSPPAILASSDPSGITYVPNRDILWIDDGEVEEVTGAPSNRFNVFEVDYSSGALVAARSTRENDPQGADFSDEPVGASAINFVGSNQYMYITDDDLNTAEGGRQIWEVHPGSDGLYGTSDDTPVLARITNRFGSNDPEGIDIGEVAPGQKTLFVADGTDNEIYKIALGSNQRLDESDPVSSFDTNRSRLYDPEGVAFNRDTGTVFAIGRPAHSLFEFNVNGKLLRKYSLPAAAKLVSPAGLAFAPSSLNSAETHIYVVDRGIDNRDDSNENDGLVFEFDITPNGGSNQDPVAIDDSVTTPLNTPATGNVLNGTLSSGSSDQDPDGDSIEVTANTTPSNGVLSSGVTSNGAFTYTPNLDFVGSDSFNYTISEDNGGTATASVDISVVASRVGTIDPTNPTNPVGGATSIEVGIATASDDAEEHVDRNGSVNSGSGDIDLTRSGGGAQISGLRFLPSIPQGATIQKAYIQFTADETGSGNIVLALRGQGADNAPTFTAASGNVSSRTMTRASVSWSPGAWSQGDAGLDQRTANIGSIIQEIVNRPGWAPGNGLVVIIKSSDPTDLDKRAAKSFEGGRAAAAKLYVEYNI